MGLQLRRAAEGDLESLIEIDLRDEGVTPGENEEPLDLEKHRSKIAGFVRDPDKAGWVFEDFQRHEIVGMILCIFRDLNSLSQFTPNWEFFTRIRQFLPSDGRFGEVFSLWVAPAFRRQGLATRLKQQFEAETRMRDMSMLYTHTELTNTHVIELNRKLGYREIRRGPIWNEIVRVSLVKDLS